MDPKNLEEVDQLKAAAPEVDQKISLAADEVVISEEVEQIRGLVAVYFEVRIYDEGAEPAG